MDKRQKYIKPELIAVPYINPLMVIGGSTGADAVIDDGESNIFAKEFDGFGESGNDGDFGTDLWEHEREKFGLQNWDEE